MKRLHICTTDIMERAVVEKEQGVIKNICVMRSESLNGRRYMKKAMESAASMVGKSFWNHETAGMGGLFGAGPRDVREMLGKLENGHQEGDGVFADLHIRKKWRDEVFELAENYSDTCGFSIVASGEYAEEKDADGFDIVEDISKLWSTDLVDEPATTHSMFESMCEEENSKQEALASAKQKALADKEAADKLAADKGVKAKPEKKEGGENDMLERLLCIMEDYFSKKDLKGATEDIALAKLSDLLKNFTENLEHSETEGTRLGDELKVSNAALEGAEKERDAFKVEVEAHKTKEEKEAKLKEQGEVIATAIEDAGLSEEDISEETYNVLLKLTAEEVATMVQTISKTVGGVHSSGKEREMEDKKDKKDKKEQIDTETFVKRYTGHPIIVE